MKLTLNFECTETDFAKLGKVFTLLANTNTRDHDEDDDEGSDEDDDEGDDDDTTSTPPPAKSSKRGRPRMSEEEREQKRLEREAEKERKRKEREDAKAKAAAEAEALALKKSEAAEAAKSTELPTPPKVEAPPEAVAKADEKLTKAGFVAAKPRQVDISDILDDEEEDPQPSGKVTMLAELEPAELEPAEDDLLTDDEGVIDGFLFSPDIVDATSAPLAIRKVLAAIKEGGLDVAGSVAWIQRNKTKFNAMAKLADPAIKTFVEKHYDTIEQVA
jgi:hypothetical protein